MASLAYPQLSSGAQVQYPFRKNITLQSPANAFADGSVITSNLNASSQTVWQLAYTELTVIDQAALQSLFTAAQGPFLPFIFIDPSDNMLSFSTNLTSGTWRADPLLSVQPGANDPIGGTAAFLLVNSAPIDQRISQTILAPAAFQYCFSIYAYSTVSTSVSLTRNAVTSLTQPFTVGANWVRLIQSGRLSDSQIGFTVSLVVPAGQSIAVFGPQLEPQLSPSFYRPTPVAGGVYQNAHFLGGSLTFESDAPGLFSTLIDIETT